MGALACILFVAMLALTWAANTAGNAAQEAQDELADTKAFLERALNERHEAITDLAAVRFKLDLERASVRQLAGFRDELEAKITQQREIIDNLLDRLDELAKAGDGQRLNEVLNKLEIETAERQRLASRNEALAEQVRAKTDELVLIRRQLSRANERVRELEEGAKTHESAS